MELTINLEDYVTPSEIKSIAMEEISKIIHSRYYSNEAELNRLITNLSYEFIFKAVSDAIGEDAKKKIADTVAKLLADDSHIRYEMWRRRDAWQNTESPAIAIMEEAIKNNKDLIVSRVENSIWNFEFDDVKEAVYNALQEVIANKVWGSNG